MMRPRMPAALALLVALLPAAVLADGGDAAPKSNAPVSPSPEPSDPEPPAGDPVGVFTGRAYYTAEDLRVSCPDLDLVMLRSYSSAPAPDGALGVGWTHAYDWRVVVAQRDPREDRARCRLRAPRRPCVTWDGISPPRRDWNMI